MKKIQMTGKNVQKAIEDGLKELNATQEEVEIKIIDEGGLFRKAKVELILDKEIEEERKESEIKSEKVLVDEISKENKKDKDKKEELNKKEKCSCKEEKCACKKEKLDGEKEKCACENNKTKEEMVNKKASSENKFSKDAIAVGTEFLTNLCKKMNIEAEITSFEQNDGITFNATGEKVGNLIGKRGETLNAIQEILSNVLKSAGFRETRFYFDVENYKNRREMSLVNLAERMAKKALKIEKPIKLERMNAYERKIIHTALQSFENISTKSEGEEPNRYLVIIPNTKK